jgi:hypothetical protein
MMSRGVDAHPGILGQIDHRHQHAPQADHALHRRRHFGRRGDRRRAHDLAHLEDVDAEGLAPAGAGIQPEGEQQDLQLVGTRQPGTRIDVLEKFGHAQSPSQTTCHPMGQVPTGSNIGGGEQS